MRNYLSNIKNFTLWKINCTINCIALTCKELNNDVRTSKKRKNEPSKWITSIESSINRIIKVISHVQPVMKCKRESTLQDIKRHSSTR